MKIFGHDYKIDFDDELEMKNSTPAQICCNIITISIDPTFPMSRQEEGLVHEVFEAIKYHLCYDDDKLPHDMLFQLSEAWYQILKCNPDYFTFKIK